jgi:hypothetical protein
MMTASLTGVLLALALPIQQQPQPLLPAPLAWLEDRDEQPRESRRLVVLLPGESTPKVLLEPLLYSFDAADTQCVRWLGDSVVVNGPKSQHRATPNVAMPLHRIDPYSGKVETCSDCQPNTLSTSNDGARLLAYSFNRVQVFRADAPFSPQDVISDATRQLGRSQIRRAVWTADGKAILLSVAGLKDGLDEGLWRIPMERWDRTTQPGAFDLVPFGDAPKWPIQAFTDGSFLAHAHGEDQRRARTLIRVWPKLIKKSDTITSDLHFGGVAAAARLGPRAHLAVAYARHKDRAIVLRSVEASTHKNSQTEEERVLWVGPHVAESITWSRNGAWIAFDARDEARKPWIFVLEVSTGKVHRLAAGLRPSWGPNPRAKETEETIPALVSECEGVPVIRAAMRLSGQYLAHAPKWVGEEPNTIRTVLPLQSLQAFVARSESDLVCHRRPGDDPYKFMVFERQGDDQAYGVYGLHLEKNDLPIGFPLRGDAIAWPDKSARQALAALMQHAGYTEKVAAAILQTNEAELLRPGRRVFLLCKAPKGLRTQLPTLSEDAFVLNIVELVE